MILRSKNNKLFLCIEVTKCFAFQIFLILQVVSLKDSIAKRDEEIERLRLGKDVKNTMPGVNGEKRGANTLRYASFSQSNNFLASS